MKAPIRLTPAGSLLTLLGLALASAGCHLDIIRARAGNPLKRDEFEKLAPGKTTRGGALERLGAPEKVEWKNGKDYLWYLYQDTVDTGIRFQFPPFRTIFGYQHTFLRLDEGSEDVNAMELVFDEKGVLERKSLRLSEAYQPAPEDGATWKLQLAAQGDYSVLLLGDGGVHDYDRLFKEGYRAGLSLGWQPVPVATLLGRATYQEHQGDGFRHRGSNVTLDDLRLYELEIGLRLAAPLSLFYDFTDFEKVKKVLFEDDLSRSVGLRFYVEGTTGIALNSNVPVKIDAVRQGNFYDRGWSFLGTLEAGLEYGWKWGAAHAGVAYQTIDGFNEGNSPLEDDGGAFQAVMVGGGVSLKF